MDSGSVASLGSLKSACNWSNNASLLLRDKAGGTEASLGALESLSVGLPVALDGYFSEGELTLHSCISSCNARLWIGDGFNSEWSLVDDGTDALYARIEELALSIAPTAAATSSSESQPNGRNGESAPGIALVTAYL